MHSVRPVLALSGPAAVRLFRVLLLCLALPAGAAPEAPARPFQVKPPAAWVRPIALEERDTRPVGETSGGVHYALFETQVRVEGRKLERYQHQAQRVLTERGIEEVAELHIRFDPSFEQLTLHGVWLHRGGQRLDVLDPAAVKVIQQERELEQRIYDGTLSALLFVRDVRVGDVIEYDYTTTGANPIFDGRYLSAVYVGYGIPVGHWRHRLLWPTARTVYVKNHGTDLSPSVTEAGGVREYVWEQRDVQPLSIDDALPGWYDPWPWIQLSEFQDWAAVARWAAPLYQPPAKLSPALEAEVKRLREAHGTPEERLLGALRFVQDEVRYLGIELGPNSHRPHAPDEVLARRFGDCKDKTLLLVTLLRALGVEARPALVHTRWRQRVASLHPSPGVFDHVITHARLGGRDYWVDPTATHERGWLDYWAPPPFRRALPVDAATTGMVELPEPTYPEPMMEVEELYTEGEEGAPVSLTVTTRMHGPEANDLRLALATSSLKNREREYLNFYARLDPKIRSTAPLSVTDDPDRNIITLVERYAIDSFWKGSRRDFSVSEISKHLTQPRITQRTMPLAIPHPLHVKQRIRFEMREPLHVGYERNFIQGPATRLDYSYESQDGGRRLVLEYRYRTLQDSVEPSRFVEHQEAVEQMNGHMSYWVKRDVSAGRGGTGLSGFDIGMILGGLTLGGLLMMMENGPRAFLRELGARKRKRAFSRKFAPVEGDLPDQAIALDDVTGLPARLGRVRCVCGVAQGAGGEAPKLEEIFLGDASLVLAKWTCSGCGLARHAYFSVKGPPR